MQYKPRHDYVLVKRHDPEKISPGGIVIPTRATEISCTAEVIAVGPGLTGENGNLIPITDIVEGDTVLIGKDPGTEIKINGEIHNLLRSYSILAKLV